MQMLGSAQLWYVQYIATFANLCANWAARYTWCITTFPVWRDFSALQATGNLVHESTLSVYDVVNATTQINENMTSWE